MPTATPTAVAAAASPKRSHPHLRRRCRIGRERPREPVSSPRRAPALNPTPALRRSPVPPPRNPLERLLTPWCIAGGGGVRAGEAQPRRRRPSPPQRLRVRLREIQPHGPHRRSASRVVQRRAMSSAATSNGRDEPPHLT